MKILILGASGFVGRNVATLLETGHEVYRASRNNNIKNNTHVDLLKPITIVKALKEIKPDVVIQCAGIVENTEASKQNPILTQNLLDTVLSYNDKIKVIICGSAAEYGNVDPKNIPVKETAPLSATSLYGVSKIEETQIALKYKKKHGLNIVVARIFNPIGTGMQPKFLTSRIVQQIQEIKNGTRKNIEVNRLDAKRDYIDVTDLAKAIKILVEHDAKYSIYNIGSGSGTSNGELVNLIINSSDLKIKPKVIETSYEPEPLVAIQADITRMKNEFDWQPSVKLEDTIKEIVNAN